MSSCVGKETLLNQFGIQVFNLFCHIELANRVLIRVDTARWLLLFEREPRVYFFAPLAKKVLDQSSSRQERF